MKAYKSIQEVKRANSDAGMFFFDPSDLAFFKTRIETGIIQGRYFVTSEVCSWVDEPKRMYTVRKVDEDGGVETVGKFRQHENRRDALEAIKKITRPRGLRNRISTVF